MKLIAAQIASMKARWPNFALVGHDTRAAVWEGELSPTSARAYTVRLSYFVPIMGERFTIGQVQPRVRVLAPLLEQHQGYEQGPLPHVYWDKDDPDRPFLCLFSPEGREWSIDDLIADTTIFWASRWLFFYEGWLATKKWKGGGRHSSQGKGAKQLASV
jgi:hypothetical protein